MCNIENEIWKDVIVDKEEPDRYKGIYQVSNLGRVKKTYKNGEERILKFYYNKKGYANVSLYRDGKTTHYLIHRLVGLTFIPNPKNLPQINHIKEFEKENNRVDNLEWCTAEYNVNYGTRNIRVSEKVKGENNSNWQGGDIICICEICGKEFERRKSYVNKNQHQYCSKECAGNRYKLNYNGSDSPNHNNLIIYKEKSDNPRVRTENVICIETKKVFKYVPEAIEFYNIKRRSSLYDVLNGKQKTAGKLEDGTKLHWMYYEDYIKEFKEVI